MRASSFIFSFFFGNSSCPMDGAFVAIAVGKADADGDNEGDEDGKEIDDDDDEEVRALLFQLPFAFGNSSFAMDGALPSKGGELKRASNFLSVTSPSLSPALPP